MIILYSNKNQLTVRKREPITSGSINVYRSKFEFSPDWEGLTRKAVFIGSGKQVPVLLDETGECDIPWEVLARHGGQLLAGVYGTREETALPTIRVSLGTILEGVTADGESPKPPTPDLWQQELAGKGDALNYTETGKLGLYSGGKLLSAVPIRGSGGEGGVSDHRLLTGRDAEGQHPISAIAGLKDEIMRIPAPVEPITNLELEELLS